MLEMSRRGRRRFAGARQKHRWPALLATHDKCRAGSDDATPTIHLRSLPISLAAPIGRHRYHSRRSPHDDSCIHASALYRPTPREPARQHFISVAATRSSIPRAQHAYKMPNYHIGRAGHTEWAHSHFFRIADRSPHILHYSCPRE